MDAKAPSPDPTGYSDWCLACKGQPDQEEADERWLQYLVERFRERRDPRVFQELLRPVRAAGIVAAHRYIVHEIDAPTFAAETRAGFSSAYLAVLVERGVSEGLPAEEFASLDDELILEALKAYEPLRGRGLMEGDDCSALAVPAATMFYRFLDRLHELLGLPRVAELKYCLTSWSEASRKVLRSGRFDAYAFSDDAERARYAAMLGKPSGA